VLEKDNPDRLEKATAFFEKLTQDKQMEGIMIKPDRYEDSSIPMMKVRNELYLHIIYRYDMNRKYSDLVKGKHIRRKLELSKNQYRLGREMLKLAINSDEMKSLIGQFLVSDQQSETIDARL
jgi:hypothetical protein